jgi:hypothetical protein
MYILEANIQLPLFQQSGNEPSCITISQRFSNVFEVGTTFISQNSSADHLTLVPFEIKFIIFLALPLNAQLFLGSKTFSQHYLRGEKPKKNN